MAKQKSGDGVDKPQAKKGHKRKWSREDHGPDKEFADRSYILNKQRFMVDPYDVPLSGEIEYVVTKKQRTQTPNNGSGDVAAKKKSGRTNNTTQSNITPAKRRGRKPGPKPGMKYKKKEKEEEQKEKSSCDCFSPHESPYGCAMEEKSAHLKSIRAKIISISDMITVFVGEEKETFPVHKDLLKLHSGLIFEHLAQEPENGKVSLPTLKPSMFAEFVLWMYTDDFLQVDHPSGEEDPCTQLWAMGAILKAPSLQNFCMEDYQTYCKQSPNVWPSVAGVELIYKLTPEGSLFRKFAAHSVSCKPPSEQHEERSEERKDWNDLFDRCPELSKDMARMGKSWNGTLAWDEVHRVEYMVDEAPVDERWEAMILNARSREEIERAAENGCRRSKIELEHLDRAEYEDHGGVDMK